MKIYIATHKKYDKFPTLDIYAPIQVGAALTEHLDYLTDDTGDNISEKNKSFCELTAHYWVWKNSKEDIVGIVHYRRYFVSYFGFLKKLLFKKNGGYLNDKTIEKYLSKYDVIIPTHSKKLPCPLFETYAQEHHAKDLQCFLDVLNEMYPEYVEASRELMNSRYFYPTNMLICKKAFFEDYCSWLFSILFEVEKRIDISSYDDYQKRVFGFIAERVLGIYMLANNVKVKNVHVINIEE